MKSREQTSRKFLLAIVLALAGWGLFLAVGAYLGMWDRTPHDGGSRDPRRFWIVLGAFGAFLAFWGAALAFRARRSRLRRFRDDGPP